MNKNHYIQAEIVFVIDEDGEALGEMNTKEAVKLAQDKELDLIEISPKANPPVAKIMSFSKYKYEMTKKRKGSKKSKSGEFEIV